MSLHMFTSPGQAGSEQDAELQYTNTDKRPCVIYGYPGLQLVGADGLPRATVTQRQKTGTATQVTVSPGASAWSLLAWRYTPNADEQDSNPLCGGKMAQVRVIPPDETVPQTVTTTLGTVCQHGTVAVWPVQSSRPSSDGPHR